jgi:hypothetical protein
MRPSRSCSEVVGQWEVEEMTIGPGAADDQPETRRLSTELRRRRI